MRRKIIHGPFTDPKKISGGDQFVARHALGLRWLAGLWQFWPALSESQRRRWRLYVLLTDAAPEQSLPPPEHWQALLFHQPALGWWAICSAGPLPASPATTLPETLQSLGPLSLLEGEAEHLQPVLDHLNSPVPPNLRRPGSSASPLHASPGAPPRS